MKTTTLTHDSPTSITKNEHVTTSRTDTYREATHHTETTSDTVSDATWRESGLCAQIDPELFFPEPGTPNGPAKRICQNCEVRQQCLQYALTHDERFGIWGGKSMSERRKLRRTTARATR